MMMTNSRPQEAADASVKPAPKASNAVEDLERRLEILGGAQDPPPPFEATGLAPPPAVSAPAVTAGNSAGKSALLARIMAAQERAKQVQKPAPAVPAAPADFLSGDHKPPAFDSKLPPPAFNAAVLPAPSVNDAPPSFEAVQDSVMNATIVNLPPPPPENLPPLFAAPPMPSAPAFEDLLDASSQQASPAMTPLPPPPMPTEETPPAAEDFAGLEGLSEAERNALIEEQRQIMEQIEKKKSGDKASEAVARAEAFDQRSNAAVAAAVDRPSSQNQHTVNLGSRLEVALQDNDGAEMTTEEAMQMEADRKMAEQLQNEEYKKAGRESRREAAAAEASQAPQDKSSGWMEWLGLAADTTTKPVRPSQIPARPPQRGELGVARPPGALSPARTGEESGMETITFAGSGSYDEQDGLLNSRGNSGGTAQGARVAEQKPLFACVADSVSTAASALSTAIQTQTLHEDKEGNIHGVDASSLLVVTQASRENTTGYEGLRHDEH